MVEFRGVVNINPQGEVVCFCSTEEALRGKCKCQRDHDCPEAIINFEIIQGSRPSERGVTKIRKTTAKIDRQVIKIRESLSQVEKSVKKFSKFRI